MNSGLIAPPAAAPAPHLDKIAFARQPIVDARRTVFGYQLFERSRSVASDDSVLFDALSDSGSQALAGRKQVFIRCAFESMADGYLEMLDPAQVVLEIGASEDPSAEAIEIRRTILARARGEGFRLAFDQSVLQPPYASWLPLASFIKLDMEAIPAESVAQVIRSAQAASEATVVVDQIKSTQQFEQLKGFGVKLFQGNWFEQPVDIRDKTVRASQATIIQLINLVRRDDVDVGDVEALLKKDPMLSFKLLRFINSVGFGLSVEITSFRHAVMILGLNKLFRWASMLMTSARPGGAAPAAGTTAVVRGRLMELLAAELMAGSECDNAFVAGVFSMLDTLAGMPLAEALESVNVPESVSAAILRNEGPLAPFLALAKACESGDEAAFARNAEELQLSNHQINWAHLEALMWADQLDQ
ncbi:MAG: HDOD domain-containing protein [Gammaproteobacteria bacterium]|nr:HDOD domain-containing protein [Gammaproteobacteria bacterium]